MIKYYLVPFETDKEKMTADFQPMHLDVFGVANGLIPKSLKQTGSIVTEWLREYYVVRVERKEEAEYSEIEKLSDIIKLDENLFEKDKDALLDYTADWTSWLGSDDLDTVTWIVPAGITKISQAETTKIAVIWLEGGTLAEIYSVICRIVTDAGRKDDRTLLFKVVEK